MFRKKKETVAADAPSTKHKCVPPGAINSKLSRSKYDFLENPMPKLASVPSQLQPVTRAKP